MEHRARRTMDSVAVTPSTNRRKDRPNRPNGLTKQTYSALVYLPGSSHPRKWHVVAYFSVGIKRLSRDFSVTSYLIAFSPRGMITCSSQSLTTMITSVAYGHQKGPLCLVKQMECGMIAIP